MRNQGRTCSTWVRHTIAAFHLANQDGWSFMTRRRPNWISDTLRYNSRLRPPRPHSDLGGIETWLGVVPRTNWYCYELKRQRGWHCLLLATHWIPPQAPVQVGRWSLWKPGRADCQWNLRHFFKFDMLHWSIQPCLSPIRLCPSLDSYRQPVTSLHKWH